MIKRISICLSLGLFSYFPEISAQTSQTTPKKTLAIAQIVEHPSLNQIREGLTKTLEKNGFGEKNAEIKLYNAQGDMVLATQIANKIVGEAPSAVVTITTPMSQAMVAKKSSLPIVFSAVNDPVGTKLVKNLDHPEGSVTGVLYVNPIAKQLQLIRDILPKAKKIGILYNAGEANSVGDAKIFSEVGKQMGFQIVEATITNTSQLFSATKSLSEKVEAIYFPTDNSVVSAVETVLNICQQQKIPAFSADSDSVKKGALATLSLNHFEIGVLTAQAVMDIWNGKKPSDIPVKIPTAFEVFLNEKTAKQLGLTFAPELKKQATSIVE